MGDAAVARSAEPEQARVSVEGLRAQGLVRWVRVTLAASSFFFFGLGGALLGFGVLPWLWLMGGSARQRRRRCQRCVKYAFRLFHAYMRTWRLLEFDAVSSAKNPRWPRGKAVVLVANHPTLIDTTAILSCLDDVVCIVTPWFGKNPLLWPLLRWCGHIVQKGDTLADRVSVLDAARERLAQGESLLVFPEGTRSPPGKLGSFQRGGFELALRAGVTLQPVAIRVYPHVLTGKTPWHDLPPCTANYRLEPLEPWLPTEYPVGRQAAREMASQVRLRIVEHLRLPN